MSIQWWLNIIRIILLWDNNIVSIMAVMCLIIWILKIKQLCKGYATVSLLHAGAFQSEKLLYVPLYQCVVVCIYGTCMVGCICMYVRWKYGRVWQAVWRLIAAASAQPSAHCHQTLLLLITKYKQIVELIEKKDNSFPPTRGIFQLPLCLHPASCCLLISLLSHATNRKLNKCTGNHC